jgi:hypothetical protein
MAFLSFSLIFGHLVVFHVVLDSRFKLCAFIINELIKGEIEKLSDRFLSLIAMSYWLGEIWIWIWDISVILPLFFISLENLVCLFRDVQVTAMTWRAVMRIVTGVEHLVQRTRDGRTGRVLIGREIEISGGAVCGLHRARGDEEHMFLCWASKLRSTICEWFGLKTTRTVFSDLASKPVATVFSGLATKPVATVSRVGPQNRQIRFGDLGLKITMTISWFGPQNQEGFGLLIAPQNRRRNDGAEHTSRSIGLLRLEASRGRVF